MTHEERLRKFVSEYKKMRQLDPQQVYALHSAGEPRFAPLLLDDIEAGADALAREDEMLALLREYLSLDFYASSTREHVLDFRRRVRKAIGGDA